jgi:hypothetical protein
MARPREVRARAGNDAVVAAKLNDIARRVGKLDPEAPRTLGLRDD